MSTAIAMERQTAAKPPKIRIEKPEISVYQAPPSLPESASVLSPVYKILIVLSYLFSTAVFFLITASF